MDLALTNTNIIIFTVVSLFLPYILTGIVLAFMAIYVMINKKTRELIFIHKGSDFMKMFFAFVLIVPFIYQNWIGFAVGVGMILGLVLGLFMRSVMTRELYEKILTLICGLSLTSSGYAIVEKLFHIISDTRTNSRISTVFSHPNYFGTVVGTIIIICAYKVLTNQGKQWFFYMVAFFNIISMYLCKSMFVWVEVFLGISVLLIVLKKHRLLAVWLSTAALGIFVILFMDISLIPRLSDVDVTVKLRMQIWDLAIRQIKAEPIFGHGFLSFSYLYDASYQNQMIPHSHSLYIDALLNFGIVGTVIFLGYFVKYYLSVFKACFKKKQTLITSLILAVTAATLVHGAADLTIFWIQTLPLFLFIMAGLGAVEKSDEVSTVLSK
ncbi:MAG: O-antigen ligase family protein [Mobilitalea sp.]